MVAVRTYKEVNLSWIKARNIEEYGLGSEKQKNIAED